MEKPLDILSGVERGYLDFVRWMIVVAVAIGGVAVVFAAGWAAVVLGGAGPSSAAGYFETPHWDDVRGTVLPLRPEVDPAGEGEVMERSGPRPVDPKIVEVADNLNAQFRRNAGQETAFTDAYPRRALESWVTERSGIPAEWQPRFLDALVGVSRQVGEDALINRIASVPDRTDTLRDAITAYRDAFRERMVAAVEQAETANRVRATETAESFRSALLLGAVGAGTVFSLVLVVVLLRIEVHLRRMGD